MTDKRGIILRQCGRRIMVITGASQASDASSILVARSIAISQKSPEKATFVHNKDEWRSSENLRIFPVFRPVRLIES